MFEDTPFGCQIGEIRINTVACANDIALLSDNPAELQMLVNRAIQVQYYPPLFFTTTKECNYSCENDKAKYTFSAAMH